VPAVSGDRLQVDVLGPLRVRDPHGHDVTPDGALQRRLLALLVLRRGQVVAPDVAIDVMWPVRPPRDPHAALHNHLFRLRRGLPSDIIESAGDGYRLDPSRIELDADRLASAVITGQPVDPAAVATIDEALGRWHGPAYPELDDFDDGRVEAVRLDELRIRAVEVRADRRLAAGHVDDVIVELAALAAEEPRRERPRALLMTALARSGRTVEALRVYDDFRRLLGDELGIEPSPALAAQHASLLRGGGDISWAPTSRLPVPVTSLVGRESLLVDVRAMVEANRLVTLIGPGGVGKTRMLVEVGARLRAADPKRPVVLCELAASNGYSAVDAVAAALAIDGRPGMGLTDRVAAVLADTASYGCGPMCWHGPSG
jgi:DNA-binding SARP family transcriptional activator